MVWSREEYDGAGTAVAVIADTGVGSVVPVGENECGDPAMTWVHDEDVEGDVESAVGIVSKVVGSGLDRAGVGAVAGKPRQAGAVGGVAGVSAGGGFATKRPPRRRLVIRTREEVATKRGGKGRAQ